MQKFDWVIIDYILNMVDIFSSKSKFVIGLDIILVYLGSITQFTLFINI
ncbi:hypothetical protein CLO_2874 [Clostridium botulinum E1 str. 'BoNT E Beluga']|nr:hypothetical protein CLO_2874 [Clostridium botulinum E1 str. 'BoNT E Beluga']